MRKTPLVLLLALLMAAGACSKHGPDPRLAFEIPAGFTGNFVLEMGVRDAPALPKDGDTYVVTMPRDGRLKTSTFLEKADVVFKNASDGSVWGYSQSQFTTGDGISVGGKIEFFVGTKKDYDAEQNKKKHSGTSAIESEYEIAG